MSASAQQILRERLQSELESSGLGKGRFALMLGISRPQLDKILAGTTDTKLSTVQKMANGLGVEVWELFRRK